jgi:hypothetical protein
MKKLAVALLSFAYSPTTGVLYWKPVVLDTREKKGDRTSGI